jgi:hypothetical protein
MKKSIILLTVIISCLVLMSQVITGCGRKSDEGHSHTHTSADSASQDEIKSDSTTLAFACPMHPEVTGKEGDTCSKCGMKLEAVKDSDSTSHAH